MSPSSILAVPPALWEASQPDRRQHFRYPVNLVVQYRLPDKGTGLGTTLNISSGGIFFKTSGPLPQRSQINLAIDWLFLLDGVCHLKLVVYGHVVRSDAKGTAIKVSTYEFRTSKARPKEA